MYMDKPLFTLEHELNLQYMKCVDSHAHNVELLLKPTQEVVVSPWIEPDYNAIQLHVFYYHAHTQSFVTSANSSRCCQTSV